MGVRRNNTHQNRQKRRRASIICNFREARATIYKISAGTNKCCWRNPKTRRPRKATRQTAVLMMHQLQTPFGRHKQALALVGSKGTKAEKDAATPYSTLFTERQDGCSRKTQGQHALDYRKITYYRRQHTLACSKSEVAPEVTFSGPKIISSATLPPMQTSIFANIFLTPQTRQQGWGGSAKRANIGTVQYRAKYVLYEVLWFL